MKWKKHQLKVKIVTRKRQKTRVNRILVLYLINAKTLIRVQFLRKNCKQIETLQCVEVPTGCLNKHGYEITTSISSLFRVGLFRKHNFEVSQLKHFTLKTISFGISKVWFTIFFTFKIDGDIWKFVQIPVYENSIKLF